jgi:4-hydroxy-4-methyl-2-oxoglutarate aldolase
VRLGGSVVSPGDLVLGDADGVIALPSSSCDGLLERAAERTLKEQRVMDELRRGGRAMDLLGLERQG